MENENVVNTELNNNDTTNNMKPKKNKWKIVVILIIILAIVGVVAALVAPKMTKKEEKKEEVKEEENNKAEEETPVEPTDEGTDNGETTYESSLDCTEKASNKKISDIFRYDVDLLDDGVSKTAQLDKVGTYLAKDLDVNTTTYFLSNSDYLLCSNFKHNKIKECNGELVEYSIDEATFKGAIEKLYGTGSYKVYNNEFRIYPGCVFFNYNSKNKTYESFCTNGCGGESSIEAERLSINETQSGNYTIVTDVVKIRDGSNSKDKGTTYTYIFTVNTKDKTLVKIESSKK